MAFHRYCEDTKLSVHGQRKCPRLVDVDTTFFNNLSVNVWRGFGHFHTNALSLQEFHRDMRTGLSVSQCMMMILKIVPTGSSNGLKLMVRQTVSEVAA